MNTGADGRQTQLVFVAGVVGPALGARPAVPCQGATGARVGCPPSSDGVQGWLLRCAVDAGWLICVASTFKVPLETRLGGGWWEKNAASSKPEIDEAGRQDYRESTVSYRGPFSTVECFLLSTSRFQTWSFETCAGIVLIVCQRFRLAVSGTGARDLVVPRYALRHIVDFPHRARPFHVLVPGRAGSAGLTGYKGSGTLLARISPLKVYGDDITYHCHRDVSMA